MDNLCVKLVLICLFITNESATGHEICKNGASCIIIVECVGLKESVHQERLFFDLLRRLHCGFQADVPMICCPLEFKKKNKITAAESSVKNNETNSLLPDWKVCGLQNNDRIVGGTLTEIDEHPWMALLEYEKPTGRGFYCGGMLISSRYVMTAAHCVTGPDLPSTWTLSKVRLGEWNVTSETDCYLGECSPPVVDVPMEEVIIHEGYRPYDRNQQNDIAILRLSMEVPFTDFVKPICLPLGTKMREMSFEDLYLEVAGWGKTDKEYNVGIKLKVKVPVKKNEECAKMYKHVNRNITDIQICAGGVPGQSSCLGDSGGPLMGQVSETNNWVAIGIVSYGPQRCGIVGWLGVYTRTTAYVDWIISKMRP